MPPASARRSTARRGPHPGSRARTRDRDLVFRALADGTRRELLVLLAKRPQSVHEFASHFAMSRPAVSKHLAVLRRAGLVEEEKVGRERVYALQHTPLEEVAQYVAAVDAFWAEGLAALGRHLDEEGR